MKEQLQRHIGDIAADLIKTSQQLYDNPELGGAEFKSAQLLVNYLKAHNFKVEVGLVERPTAFRAIFESEKPGATIGFMAEYDALPGVGHGCGHNLIGTMSVGAAIALSKVLHETGGRVIVYGTPAEETNGAKVPMAEAGLFNELDIAMMVHPAGESVKSGASLAMDALEFSYRGKSSHAAAAPEEGINALDSVLQLFSGINALRQHVKSDVRIHGIIPEGGQAANVVPDYAVAQFYVRAQERKYLNQVVKKIKRIAQSAADMTGATLAVRNYELSYDDMRTNQTLSAIYSKNLIACGETLIHDAKGGLGSIDMGNVSHVVPAIHPYISLDSPGLVAHTKEFANQTVTDSGRKALVRGALSLAMTGFDILNDATLLEQINQEFDIN
ncbi:amidohydrolase [Amphibacillus marinus]|uniref:Peptidase M20 domain-containing protein 2 n=1 Tax=Amphibacillus marinus TaxID=872970 RepID=A0A1H8IF64_9BACI|nr:M20 family metallopeptidase [Amphibacillus marinus]SEN67343.1 amidohydrolase [Amphibacillus marinus]